MNETIFISDLTHTASGIHSTVFPLGAGKICSYAKRNLSDKYKIELFKFPEELIKNLIEQKPKIIAFSNYLWNLDLSYKIASKYKEAHSQIIIIFGGPNFPYDSNERIDFFQKYPNIDFYIYNEGELGFVDLIKKLEKHSFSKEELQKTNEAIINCSYLRDNKLINGELKIITHLDDIPSPYLEGIFDKFFDAKLSPLVETTRGCPFSCTYCSDGHISKSNIRRYSKERIETELLYIANNIKKIDELNFGMYKEDIGTATIIREIHDKYKYPKMFHAATGKNNKENIIKTALILKDLWLIDSAIQSSDPEVLKNIKRNNINLDSFQKTINETDDNVLTYTEIILGLPGDSKKRHFASIFYSIDISNVDSVRMYQAILLVGTEMATNKSRTDFEIKSKFRIIPSCLGSYKFNETGEIIKVAEIEEIVVSGKYLSFEDYIDCRIMNLLTEMYYNNALFEEIFNILKKHEISPFECLKYISEHEEIRTEKFKEILQSFIKGTTGFLFDSYEEAYKFATDDENLKKLVKGKIGVNELLYHKYLLYDSFEDSSEVLLMAIREILKNRNLVNNDINNFLSDLFKFIIFRKKSFYNFDEIYTIDFKYDFLALAKIKFMIKLDEIQNYFKNISLKIYHNEEQKNHIKNMLNLYPNTKNGKAKMIQRSNFKKINRVAGII